MSFTAKQQSIKEIMQFCDTLRNVADNFETTDSAMTALGFKSGGVDPIAVDDLSGTNLTMAQLTEAFKVVRDFNKIMSGADVTPEDLKTKLDSLKYWR